MCKPIPKLFNLLVFLGLFGFASQAYAAVELKVAVVHATKAKSPTDSKISKVMAKSLTTVFGQYGSFKLLSKTAYQLVPKKTAEIDLPTGYKALVKYVGSLPKAGKNKVHKLSLEIPKHKVKVKLRAIPKKLFYQAGIKHNNGILILAFYLKE
ncbi:MAG: hypothetical protein CMH52_02810 [Myxococcales bacterium]|nr:hypothetical protein [Myxococcales bacterium]|tara:strand:+ start:1382 stop:1840 length:459 start_codon:yes stop_codon:yes gene_type:complete